jgi:hypothetical protein
MGMKEAVESPTAINRFFSDRAEILSREIKELFRIGRRTLAVGLMVLVFCLLISQFLDRFPGQNVIGGIVVESLIIVGWVASDENAASSRHSNVVASIRV